MAKSFTKTESTHYQIVRAMRAQAFIEAFLEDPESDYGQACRKIAELELSAAVGADVFPDRYTLLAFNAGTHKICKMVNDQCVFCGND